MPVIAGCPKCQARYNLPDKYVGTTIKCKKCQSPFKVAAASANPPAKTPIREKVAVAAASKSSASRDPSVNSLYAEFGLDGPLKKPNNDVFAGLKPLPAKKGAADTLTNYAAEDPGFAEPEAAEAAAKSAAESDNSGLSGVLANPALKGRQSASPRQSRSGKSKSSDTKHVITGQKLLIYSLVAYFGLIMIFFMAGFGIGLATRGEPPESLMLILNIVGIVFHFLILFLAIYGILRLGSVLYPGATRWLFAVALLVPIPLLSIIIMIIANAKAIRFLKDRNIKVGFFGAR